MNKRYQRANWGRRPLPVEMLDYARLDSHYLIPLQERLRDELQSTGRWELALEDFQRLTQNIEDTTESKTDDYWKLRGAHDLNPEQAAVLKSVYLLRESLAERQNKPPFKIFGNKVIMEIAEICPEDEQSLSRVTCLSDRLKSSYGKQILRVVRQSRAAPPEFPPSQERADNGVLERMDVLREWRKTTACGLGVPSDVILPRDVLNRIARGDPKNTQALKKLMKDVPYRYHRFGSAMIKLLKKGT
jgi:ribonuclease D